MVPEFWEVHGLRDLSENVWQTDELIQMVDRIISTISTSLTDELKAATDVEASELKQFIRNHKQRILDELDAGLVDWDRPPNPPLCAVATKDANGELKTTIVFEGTLSTTFGTSEDEILSTGDGKISEIMEG